MKQFEDTIKFDFKKGIYRCSCVVYLFKDGNSQIAYAPSLQVSGYGDTLTDAMEMLDSTMNNYFQNMLEAGQKETVQELTHNGWVSSSIFKKQFHNSSFVDTLGVLRNFDLPEDTKIQVEKILM
ncbi:MAG: hypothetical protein L7V85_02300 [Bacteroidia bacterium]|nr:hypothetical protein [Bacteroidia bacterium]